MRLDVALTPASLPNDGRRVCVVIDVLRASSSLVTLFGRGLDELLLAETVEEARSLAEAHPDALLCGEEHSLPPRGFHHGNSPAEFDALDLAGRRAVLVTTNGTRALVSAAGCPVVLIGALLNLTAVARCALREATAGDLDLTALCAGQHGGRDASLEDTFCAGALVEELSSAERRLELADGALTARWVYRSFRGNARHVFRASPHGAALAALGFERDLAFCAQRDRFAVAPRLELRPGGGTAVVR